ncbi:hypothetical protein PINS_up005571 [Pythium insidiosum]|nr:hypothetical protein PINS_up005571 [Pythium insidiosum]
MRLLGLSTQSVVALESALLDGAAALRPGFTRLNVAYFMDDEEVEYVLSAVHFVATDGWRFLSLYEIDPKAGTYKFKGGRTSIKHLPGTTVEAFKADDRGMESCISDIHQHRRMALLYAQELASHLPIETGVDHDESGASQWFIANTDSSSASCCCSPRASSPAEDVLGQAFGSVCQRRSSDTRRESSMFPLRAPHLAISAKPEKKENETRRRRSFLCWMRELFRRQRNHDTAT